MENEVKEIAVNSFKRLRKNNSIELREQIIGTAKSLYLLLFVFEDDEYMNKRLISI